MDYLLTYAGVPFVADEAQVFQISQPGYPIGTKKEHSPTRKQQAVTYLVDELNRILPFEYLEDFEQQGPYPGRNLGAAALPWKSATRPNPHVKIGDWYWPTGASRFSVFRGLATSSQMKAMLAETAGCQSAELIMKSTPSGAGDTIPNSFTLIAQMFMLPPRPLAEHGGRFDGLYLITLVDARYYWRGTGVSLSPKETTSWDSVITSLGTAVGVTPIYTSIPSSYTRPEPDSQLFCNWENAALLLDIAANNIGRTVVRDLDGVVYLYTPAESQAKVLFNRGDVRTLVRTAGGDMFSSGTNVKAGNLFHSKNPIIPASLTVTFPKYVQGDDPVPHFVNSRYKRQRQSCWYEDSYGDVYSVNVPVTSGGIAASGYVSTSGLSGYSTSFIHNTAKALYSGEIQASGDPINQSGLTALAMQISRDYYASQVAAALDEVYPGTINLSLEGIHDVIWTYSAHARQAVTRVLRTEWNSTVTEMQHATPALSGFTNTPKGIGGPSVAQSWIDGTNFSGWNVSLQKAMGSGDYFAVVDDAVYMPTQNRWRGKLIGNNTSGESRQEIVLLEGTSGGIATTTVSGVDVSGSYRVDIALRGIDGTLSTDFVSGVILQQIYPSATYGVNLVRFEKGQFVYPQEWTSGGIQGVNVVPQTQTVYAYSATAMTINGVPVYSGKLQVGDTTSNVNSGQSLWEDQEYVWIVNRNIGQGIKSGGRYDGQYIGVSAVPANPTYAVNSERVVKEVICLPDGGLSVTYGNT